VVLDTIFEVFEFYGSGLGRSALSPIWGDRVVWPAFSQQPHLCFIQYHQI